jgi:hypothetical protein
MQLLACNADPASTGGGGTGGVAANGGNAGAGGAIALTLETVDPPLIDPLGGSRLWVTGTGFDQSLQVSIDGAPASFELLSDSSLWLVSPPASGPNATLRVEREGLNASYSLEVWSPAELEGASLFDAASGLALEEEQTHYEWQRLTAEIAPAWRVRDGNTTTWLPATGRYWMVGGWNGYQEPDGFSTVPDGTVYPPENTTNEVWSSPDGVAWTLDLEHGHSQFQRRHVHSTLLFNEALWVIGGDTHQGFYNHDVLRSSDGLNWEQVLPPGAPPWQPRALHISGVFAGKLWMGGGQTLLGPEEEYVYFNDLWSSADGERWTQVAANGPESEARWAGCGMVESFVEFQGRMWLVGCARYREVAGHELHAEVWSTADGIEWTRHSDPPWAGKGWHNVVVWDGKLWALFGYTQGDPKNGWAAGNANEAWYSNDGESWASLPVDSPVPGSHAQGVAVREDSLLYSGGNYSFVGDDKSAWRLVPFRGPSVRSWTPRGSELEVLAEQDDARPVRVEDAFGAGAPGLHFDGSTSVLALATSEQQPSGRTVLWVGRMPYLPNPSGWDESYAPVGTVLGGPDETGMPSSSIGMSQGSLLMANREAGTGPAGEPLWARIEAGEGLQEGPGAVHVVGMTHAIDGSVTAWIDGARIDAGVADYSTPRSWSRLGGSFDGNGYYGPNTRFAGTLGAVLVANRVLSDSELAKVESWARARFRLNAAK